MKIKLSSKGDFSKAVDYLTGLKKLDMKKILEKYGELGVDALLEATPKRTGLTSRSWNYKVTVNNREATINWFNTNVQNGMNIAVILQYGHGTKSGGYVRGRDYINPAMQPIFDEIADLAWKEVTDL